MEFAHYVCSKIGAMRFDIVTIFPEFFGGPLEYGIVRRAREARLIETHVHDLRDFTHDRHHVVDDRPFGGGEGMVMKAEPIFEAVESLAGEASPSARPGVAIVLSPLALRPMPRRTTRVFVADNRCFPKCLFKQDRMTVGLLCERGD